jgi:hypothetical protein
MYSYVQIFRNGFLEASHFDFFNQENENLIFGVQVEEKIKTAVNDYIAGLDKFSIVFPFFISLSFLNTKGYKIVTSKNNSRIIHSDFSQIFDEDLLLPTIFLENKEELNEKLKICFDVFWNSNGYVGSPNE